MSSSADPVIVTENLTKRYGEFTALSDLSFSLDRARILGFIGPNGAGKTTTIKILVGLARPTSGEARIAGVDCTRDARKIKRLVGYMPDRFGAYDNMRVREYLDFFGAAYGIPRKKRAARIEETLEITSAGYMRDRYVEALSHGMQQRVGIARVLLHDPQVLILDEPANGLDPQARVEMRELLTRLARMGKTLIVTSHILPELSRICDVVAIVTGGKLRAFGTLDEIARAMSPRRTIEVQLSGPEKVAIAQAIIERFEGNVAEIVASTAEATVRFSTNRPESDWTELLSLLLAGNAGVTQFRELQTDLEDVFQTVVRQGDDAPRAQEWVTLAPSGAEPTDSVSPNPVATNSITPGPAEGAVR